MDSKNTILNGIHDNISSDDDKCLIPIKNHEEPRLNGDIYPKYENGFLTGHSDNESEINESADDVIQCKKTLNGYCKFNGIVAKFNGVVPSENGSISSLTSNSIENKETENDKLTTFELVIKDNNEYIDIESETSSEDSYCVSEIDSEASSEVSLSTDDSDSNNVNSLNKYRIEFPFLGPPYYMFDELKGKYYLTECGYKETFAIIGGFRFSVYEIDKLNKKCKENKIINIYKELHKLKNIKYYNEDQHGYGKINIAIEQLQKLEKEICRKRSINGDLSTVTRHNLDNLAAPKKVKLDQLETSKNNAKSSHVRDLNISCKTNCSCRFSKNYKHLYSDVLRKIRNSECSISGNFSKIQDDKNDNNTFNNISYNSTNDENSEIDNYANETHKDLTNNCGSTRISVESLEKEKDLSVFSCKLRQTLNRVSNLRKNSSQLCNRKILNREEYLPEKNSLPVDCNKKCTCHRVPYLRDCTFSSKSFSDEVTLFNGKKINSNLNGFTKRKYKHPENNCLPNSSNSTEDCNLFVEDALKKGQLDKAKNCYRSPEDRLIPDELDTDCDVCSTSSSIYCSEDSINDTVEIVEDDVEETFKFMNFGGQFVNTSNNYDLKLNDLDDISLTPLKKIKIPVRNLLNTEMKKHKNKIYFTNNKQIISNINKQIKNINIDRTLIEEDLNYINNTNKVLDEIEQELEYQRKVELVTKQVSERFHHNPSWCIQAFMEDELQFPDYENRLLQISNSHCKNDCKNKLLSLYNNFCRIFVFNRHKPLACNNSQQSIECTCPKSTVKKRYRRRTRRRRKTFKRHRKQCPLNKSKLNSTNIDGLKAIRSVIHKQKHQTLNRRIHKLSYEFFNAMRK